jgi:hypothetical protein
MGLGDSLSAGAGLADARAPSEPAVAASSEIRCSDRPTPHLGPPRGAQALRPVTSDQARLDSRVRLPSVAAALVTIVLNDHMTAAKAFIMGRNMFGPVRGEWDRRWNGTRGGRRRRCLDPRRRDHHQPVPRSRPDRRTAAAYCAAHARRRHTAVRGRPVTGTRAGGVAGSDLGYARDLPRAVLSSRTVLDDCRAFRSGS